MYTFLQKNIVFFSGLLLLAGLVAAAGLSEHSHDDGAARPQTENNISGASQASPLSPVPAVTGSAATTTSQTKTLTPASPSVTSPVPPPQPAPTVIPRTRRGDDD
jgi:hypothetical protein